MDGLQQTLLALSLLLLASCTLFSVQSTDREAETDLRLHVPTMMQQEQEALLQETLEVQEGTYATQADALQFSYESAIAVRDLIVEISDQFEPEARKALDEALTAFSEDIEELKQYGERAKHGPLSDADNQRIATLSATIEEAMNTFAAAIELML